MYKEFSVVLVIPDFYEKSYVRDTVHLLLKTMGFKQLCAQQEALAATYGAGLTTACVVDIGATTASVACVDEGMVIADTRMFLNMGGDYITEFLPGKPAEKYGLRAYDEIILGPMCLFEPRVIDFSRRRIGMRPFQHPDVTEELWDNREHRDSLPADQFTQAMIISTQHLFVPPSLRTSRQRCPSKRGCATVRGGRENRDVTRVGRPRRVRRRLRRVRHARRGAQPRGLQGRDAAAALEHRRGGDAHRRRRGARAEPAPPPASRYDIDIAFEASKLPMDVAIFNSTRAAGGDEKIRKYLQAVLVIGGTALVPGMEHALESRLQAIATPLVANMDKVQIISPTKDVDPRILVWKGASVLGRMDGVADLWLTPSDWDTLGMRGLRERCFYL
ncbi:actin-like ATPase domain-containing protein [Auriscalpium vulgare]|uniref:Actin-like ATPase domain-containing protein n=1 Tax=Auriscalpium vulgare TaxID=40419 RepID=A0ACB8R2K3_9AGAM|nr:actin-like ATPase domain-containing protein [Auriscalpium vulgare]